MILGWLFRHDPEQIAPAKTAQINELIGRIVAMHPRLKMAPRYKERLTDAVAATLQYIERHLDLLPAALEASVNAWSSDPCMRAFFATPDDLVQAFGRSEELREFFDWNCDAMEAYAALRMAMTERHVLGVAVEGDQVRHDVPQTTLMFGDYHVRMCALSETELRQEIGHRMVNQLVLEGLAKLGNDRHELLAQGRELLQTRKLLLQRQGAGMHSVVGGGSVVEAEELSRVQAQIEENTRNLDALNSPTETIALELKGICDVLSEPESHLFVKNRRIRIDQMNVIQDAGGRFSNEIELHFAHIPGDPPQTRAFVLVRFSRTELPQGGLRLDAAMRGLV